MSDKPAKTRPGISYVTGLPAGQLNIGGNGPGNPFGAGRKPNEVRATFLRMTDELVLPYLKSILNEEQVVTDYTNDGVEFKRKPKSHEKRWAADQLMKISLGSTSQVDITTQGEKIGAIDDIGRRAILAAADEIQQSE